MRGLSRLGFRLAGEQPEQPDADRAAHHRAIGDVERRPIMIPDVPLDEVDWVRIEIPRLMASVAALKVPLLAEIGVGENWDKAH